MEYKAKVFRHDTFGKLRVVSIDGEPWFVGKDVATALGYKNTRDALTKHVDLRDKRVILKSQFATLGTTLEIPNRGLIVINKSGVYSLILDSQLPKAKEYRHWVTSEVLPQVDETGSYSRTTESAPDLASLQAQINELKSAIATLANTIKSMSVVEKAPVVALPEESLDTYRVYLFLLSDGNVKIGFSKRFCSRIGEVKREINNRRKADGKEELTFKDVYYTPKITCEDARLVERCFKEIFSEEHIEDEIFSVAFKTARAKIKYLVKLSVAKLPSESVKFIADKQV